MTDNVALPGRKVVMAAVDAAGNPVTVGLIMAGLPHTQTEDGDYLVELPDDKWRWELEQGGTYGNLFNLIGPDGPVGDWWSKEFNEGEDLDMEPDESFSFAFDTDGENDDEDCDT